MQEQFIGRAAHGPASKHPTLPLLFSAYDLEQHSFGPKGLDQRGQSNLIPTAQGWWIKLL